MNTRPLMSAAMFSLIADERRRVADLLEGLTPEQWESPSSCAGWSVKVLASHLAAGPELGMRSLVAEVLKSRGNPDVANDRLARRIAERPTAEIVRSVREHANSKFAPPVLGAAAPLTDVVIHALDIAIPLGLDWEPPLEATYVALQSGTAKTFQTANHYRSFKEVQFAATDCEWQWGSGQRVEGRSIDLAHTLWGRSDVIDSLSGPGTEQLRTALTSIN